MIRLATGTTSRLKLLSSVVLAVCHPSAGARQRNRDRRAPGILLSRRLLTCSLFGLLLGCSDTVNPQGCTVRLSSGCWTFLGLDGKWITALAETPWGLYAGTADAGVFRLVGDRWQSVGLNIARGYISALVYTGTTPPRLFAAIGAKRDTAGTNDTQGAVYATEDGGGTWKPRDGGLDARQAAIGDDAWAYSLAVDPGNPNRIFMGLDYPVMRSEDGGASWQFVWGSENDLRGWMWIPSLVVFPGRDGHIWAGGQTAIFTAAILGSSDWGDTWKFVDPTPTFENSVQSLAVDPADPDRLWAGLQGVTPGVLRSADGGQSWDYVLRLSASSAAGSVNAIAETSHSLYAVAWENFRAPPDGNGTPLTDLGLYRSRDAGESWDTLAVPTGAGGGVTTTVDPLGRLVIGTRPGSGGSGVWLFAP
jgi:hypothetical protein